MANWISPVAVLAALAALGIGCNHTPHAVLKELPVPAPSATPAALAPAAEQPPSTAASEAESETQPVAEDSVPAGWIPATPEHAWRYIVIHHSATDTGNAEVFDQIHRDQRGWDELGYHFVITNGSGGPDGTVQVGPRWNKQKWGAHCGGTPDNRYNDLGIGICLVGRFDERMPSDGQMASMMELTRFLVIRYGIDPDDVIAHCDAPNSATACPGDQLHAYIRNRLVEDLELKAHRTDRTDSPASTAQREL